MAFRLRPGEPVARELSRVVAEEFAEAIEGLVRQEGADRAEAVHGVRTCVKKTRAVLHLLEKNLGDDYGALDGRLRRIAHRLSPLRDLDAGAETVIALRDRYPGLVTGPVLRAAQQGLRAGVRRAEPRLDPERLFGQLARALERSREPVRRGIRGAARSSAVRVGVARGYRRARHAMASVCAHPDDAQFHRWRRRVKDHWYRVRLIEGLADQMPRRIGRLKQLETCLGTDHDLVVLRETLVKSSARFGDPRMTAVVLGCMATYQTALRRHALKRGRRLFARTARDFRARMDGRPTT